MVLNAGCRCLCGFFTLNPKAGWEEDRPGKQHLRRRQEGGGRAGEGGGGEERGGGRLDERGGGRLEDRGGGTVEGNTGERKQRRDTIKLDLAKVYGAQGGKKAASKQVRGEVASAVERIWHVYDRRYQILASAFRLQSLNLVRCFLCACKRMRNGRERDMDRGWADAANHAGLGAVKGVVGQGRNNTFNNATQVRE